MLNLGIIGTNWITKQFIDAAHETGDYRLMSIYSRSIEKGLEFGKDYTVTTVFDELNGFFDNPEMDVVYIASPNSLHFTQSKQALLAGKHVIVEKPAVTTKKEWLELMAIAKEQKCFFFEAARNIHEGTFKQITELLSTMDNILGANLNFMKYSSRYDLVLAGEEPNIFSPKFAGGALMDLGIYVVYAAVAWFGQPESVHYFSRKIVTDVDGLGTIIFRYPTFDVTMQTGKIANSDLPSEIYTKDNTIMLDAVNSISAITITDLKSGTAQKVTASSESNPMVEEAKDFAKIMLTPPSADNLQRYNEWLAIGGVVHEIMEELRQQGKITFPTDSF